MEPHRKAILCLCCDTNTLQVRQMLLEHFGYRVFAASSVDDAKNIAENRCPDLLLMDNSHPEVDPEQVATQVKMKYPGVIAVVLSPYYYGAGKASRSAIDRFVTSNDGPDVLISQIEELLEDTPAGAMQCPSGCKRTGDSRDRTVPVRQHGRQRAEQLPPLRLCGCAAIFPKAEAQKRNLPDPDANSATPLFRLCFVCARSAIA